MKTRHNRRIVGATHASLARENQHPRKQNPVGADSWEKPGAPIPPVPCSIRPSRRLRLPPIDSDVWPAGCRGRLWDWSVARFYVRRCQLCAHACRPPESRRQRESEAFLPFTLLCTEHPDSPGQLREVWPTGWCRNFRPVRVERPRVRRRSENIDERLVDWSSPVYKCYEGSRRIKLSNGRFVIVDPQDYEELSRHKWCACSKRGGMVYAMRRDKKGRTIYMHRQIAGAKRGSRAGTRAATSGRRESHREAGTTISGGSTTRSRRPKPATARHSNCMGRSRTSTSPRTTAAERSRLVARGP